MKMYYPGKDHADHDYPFPTTMTAACAMNSFAFPCLLSVSQRPFRPVITSARHCTRLRPVESGAGDFRSWSFPNRASITSHGK